MIGQLVGIKNVLYFFVNQKTFFFLSYILNWSFVNSPLLSYLNLSEDDKESDNKVISAVNTEEKLLSF